MARVPPPDRKVRGPMAVLPDDQVSAYFTDLGRRAHQRRLILTGEQVAALAALAPIVNQPEQVAALAALAPIVNQAAAKIAAQQRAADDNASDG